MIKQNQERKYLIKRHTSLPHLIEIQLDSYKWFMQEGLSELFEEVSPVIDFTGEKMELKFSNFGFEKPGTDIKHIITLK